MDVNSQFMKDFTEALNNGASQSIETIIKNNLNHIRNNAWDIIPLLGAQLSSEALEENYKRHLTAQIALNLILNEMDPDDAALQLVGEMGKLKEDDRAFGCFLKGFGSVLPNVEIKRSSILLWSFSAIHSYLTEIDVPEYNLNDEEQMILDADPTIERISLLYFDVFEFVDGLVESMDKECQRSLLVKFIVDVLGKPLVYLDMKVHKDTKSRARRIGENLARKLLSVEKDPILILEKQKQKTTEESSKPDTIGLSSLFYIILEETPLLIKTPKVYDPVYVFNNSLNLTCELFEYKNSILLSKALTLTRNLLNSINGFTLSYEFLDFDCHSRFCKHISNIVIYNNESSNRKEALKLFEIYLKAFDTAGKYLIILNLMKFVKHGGFAGFLITQYKDMLDRALKEHQLSPHFTGEKLIELIHIFCHLHRAEETDLIEISDQIVAALNLLRYLAIRDKDNLTGIWNSFKHLEKRYFDPLKKGLILSKAHYELKLKELKESIIEETRKGGCSHNVSITVAGEKLPEMPLEEKLKVLTGALTTFDVMESLLGRLIELIETKTK